jgi:hypothetical protein
MKTLTIQEQDKIVKMLKFKHSHPLERVELTVNNETHNAWLIHLPSIKVCNVEFVLKEYVLDNGDSTWMVFIGLGEQKHLLHGIFHNKSTSILCDMHMPSTLGLTTEDCLTERPSLGDEVDNPPPLKIYNADADADRIWV